MKQQPTTRRRRRSKYPIVNDTLALHRKLAKLKRLDAIERTRARIVLNVSVMNRDARDEYLLRRPQEEQRDES